MGGLNHKAEFLSGPSKHKNWIGEMWIVEALHYILFWGNMGQSDNYVAGNKESALQIALLVAVKRDGRKKVEWIVVHSLPYYQSPKLGG